MAFVNTLYGTYPSVVHFPGAFLDGMSASLNLMKGILKTPRPEFKLPAGLSIVTWNSRSDRSSIERRCGHIGINVCALSAGPPTFHWGMKGSLLVEFAASGSAPELILAMDAFDTVIQSDVNVCVDELDRLKCDALFGGEACFAFGCEADRMCEEAHYPGPFRYLNAGLMIARTEFIRGLTGVDWLRNDQAVWHHLHRELYPRIRVDYGCRVFQNVNIHPSAPLDVFRVTYGMPRMVRPVML